MKRTGSKINGSAEWQHATNKLYKSPIKKDRKETAYRSTTSAIFCTPAWGPRTVHHNFFWLTISRSFLKQNICYKYFRLIEMIQLNITNHGCNYWGILIVFLHKLWDTVIILHIVDNPELGRSQLLLERLLGKVDRKIHNWQICLQFECLPITWF